MKKLVAEGPLLKLVKRRIEMGTPQVQTAKCQHCAREFTAAALTLREAMQNLFEAVSNHVREAHSAVHMEDNVRRAHSLCGWNLRDESKSTHTQLWAEVTCSACLAEKAKTKSAQESKQPLADRIRQACQLSFDGNPKAIRSHLHGLRINLRNLATEVEKLEKRNVAELLTSAAALLEAATKEHVNVSAQRAFQDAIEAVNAALVRTADGNSFVLEDWGKKNV